MQQFSNRQIKPKCDESNISVHGKGQVETDPEKGILLCGPIGTGKSTIMQIMNRYRYFVSGQDKGGYPMGGFRIDSASFIANSFSMRGKDALELYTYNNGSPRMMCFDELGVNPFRQNTSVQS